MEKEPEGTASKKWHLAHYTIHKRNGRRKGEVVNFSKGATGSKRAVFWTPHYIIKQAWAKKRQKKKTRNPTLVVVIRDVQRERFEVPRTGVLTRK